MTLSDILTVSLLTGCIVAVLRRIAPRIDGPWLVAVAAVPAGAAVAAALQWWPVVSVWLDAHPIVGVPLYGAAAAFLAMGGLDLLRSIAAQAGSYDIDARTEVHRED